MIGCPTSTGAPQLVQNWRWLFSVLLYIPSLSAPFTTFTFDAGHRLAAWIGAPSQLRQELQWQYTCTAGSPLISSCTAPHAHPLLYAFAMRIPPLQGIFHGARSDTRQARSASATDPAPAMGEGSPLLVLPPWMIRR